jgi:hypothetical protein
MTDPLRTLQTYDEYHRMKRFLVGPAALALIATLVAAFPILRPRDVIDLGSLDLRQGASRLVSFSVGYSDPFAIGVRIDQVTAKRMFPCMVDPDVFALHSERCNSSNTNWPVRLAFRLTANGTDISREIGSADAGAGGRYDGNDTYTWEAAFVPMRPGVVYQLAVRSLGDGTALRAASPRLVVLDVNPAFGDEQALAALASFAIAAVLLLAAAIWLVIGLWASWRAHAKA